MLRVDIHTTPAAAKLFCSGRIVLGVEAETLRCIATARAERCLILDLRGIHTIDAAGLGLLAELHCRAQERTSLLIIANPSRWVCQLLALTRLQSALRIAYSAGAEAGCEEPDQDDTQQAMTA